jgi:outer membrane lipoprotein-sorting protein
MQADQPEQPAAPWLLRAVRATTLTQRVAAAVVIVVGALALVATFALMHSAGSSAVAFADVAGKLRSARTLSFTSTVTMPGQQPRTIRTMMADSRRIRSETPDGMISILNGQKTHLFVPQAQTKSAPRVDPSAPPRIVGAERGIIDALRALADQPAEPLGDAKIDGVDAVAFRTTGGQQRQPATIWADKKTGVPLRVEMTLTRDGKPTRVVMEQFEIDLPLDDSLFSPEPPPEYELALPAVAPPTTGQATGADLEDIELAVVDVLRSYAAANDGAFPPNLLDWQGSVMMQIKGQGDPQLMQKVGRLTNLLTSHPSGYGYAGRDVTLGEKNRIVFWYQPEKSRTYRAVYGDLRVADVTAAQLPEDQSRD